MNLTTAAQVPIYASPGLCRNQSLTAEESRDLENLLKARGYQPPPQTATSADSQATPERWVYAKTLEGGSEAIKLLYVRLDTQNKILDRVVQRNVRLGTAAYNDPFHWKTGQQGILPREAWVLEMIGRQQKHVIGFRHFVLDPENAVVATYCDFAEGGDMDDLIARHARKSRQRVGKRYPKSRNASALFEESWLWYLFQSLASALISIQDGGIGQRQSNEAGRLDWEIVHSDLHPGNILFAAKDSERMFRQYPIPKISDFGSACPTYAGHKHAPDDDDNRPIFNNVAHDERFDPPELDGADMNNPISMEEPTDALTPVNVYQIGLIILCCMQLQSAPDPSWDSENPDIDAGLAKPYSEDLKGLVKDCLNFQPSDRPSPRDLLASIKQRGHRFFHRKKKHSPRLKFPKVDQYRVGKYLSLEEQKTEKKRVMGLRLLKELDVVPTTELNVRRLRNGKVIRT